MSDFETRLKRRIAHRLADLDSQRARARRLRVGANFEISVNRRSIGTPDRHPIGTPSSYVSGD